MSRYIDADKLIEQGYILTQHGKSNRLLSTMSLADVKTADVEEVRHSKWVEDEELCGDTIYRCPICDEEFSLIDGTPTENLYNYCPNCGAKMDVRSNTMVMESQEFEMLVQLSDKYNLSSFEIENTVDDIETFLEKMNWLICNTEQVSEEDSYWVSKIDETWGDC